MVTFKKKKKQQQTLCSQPQRCTLGFPEPVFSPFHCKAASALPSKGVCVRHTREARNDERHILLYRIRKASAVTQRHNAQTALGTFLLLS